MNIDQDFLFVLIIVCFGMIFSLTMFSIGYYLGSFNK